MASKPRLALALALIIAAAFADPLSGEGPPRRALFLAELSGGPLLGIDRPLKGCSGGILLGAAIPPFEAALRAGAAYDLALESGSLRLDLELGLGKGLRAIVGGLIPLGELALADPAGGPALPVEAAAWPNRFGFASTIAELPWPVLGARAGIEVELVYTAYQLGSSVSAEKASLSGTAAFAAAVEARVALRFALAPPWPPSAKASGSP
jgi:hypothetical protein